MAVLFYLTAVPFAALFGWGVARLVRRVRGAGKGGAPGQAAGRSVRAGGGGLGRVLRLGLGQRRLRSGPLAGWTHLAISGGFAALFLGSLVVLADGHLLRPFGGGLPAGRFHQLFQGALDLAGLAFVAGVAMALLRRLSGRGLRGGSPAGGRPASAALLGALLFLGLSGFLLEALRLGVEGGGGESWAFAGRALAALPVLADAPEASRAGLFRALWWVHGLVALGFVAALPWTALRHLLSAPANLLVSPEGPRPASRAPFDLRELLAGGDLDVRVGIASAGDLGWRDRLALAACTDCGACDLVCPAVASGAALAPRRLVQALWRASDGDGAPADLFESAIAPEEVWACTLCAACSGACPVLVRPPEAVLELRRALVARHRLPARGAELLAHLARSGNPYGLPHRDREDLPAALGAPTLAEEPDAEVLYWPGCTAAYDPRVRRVARATVALLRRAGVRFAVLGAEERCCGDAARRLGEEGRYQELALGNLETLERHGVQRVLTHCAHCFDTLANDYPELGGRFETVHHTAYLDELVRSGRLEPAAVGAPLRATLHDACCACRFNGLGDEPRRLLAAVPGLEMVEMPRRREAAFCCGGGGAGYWYDAPRPAPVSTLRLAEAAGTGADVVAVECPFCLRELEGAASSDGSPAPAVRDVAELVAGSLGLV